MERALRRQKMDVVVGARPTANDIDVTKDGVTMRLKDAKGKEKTVQAEALLVGIGREATSRTSVSKSSASRRRRRLHPGRPDDADQRRRASTRSATSTASRCWPTPRMHHGIIAVEHICGLESVPARRAQLALLHLLRAGDRLASG